MTVRNLLKKMDNLMFPSAFYKSLAITTMWISFPWHIVTNGQTSTSIHRFEYKPISISLLCGKLPLIAWFWIHLYMGIKQRSTRWGVFLSSSILSPLRTSSKVRNTKFHATGFFYLPSPLYPSFSSFLGSNWFSLSHPPPAIHLSLLLFSGTHSEVNALIPKSKSLLLK